MFMLKSASVCKLDYKSTFRTIKTRININLNIDYTHLSYISIRSVKVIINNIALLKIGHAFMMLSIAAVGTYFDFVNTRQISCSVNKGG